MSKKILAPILLLAWLLASCSPKPTQSQPDTAPIFTEAAKTVAAALTATAISQPLPTATVTPTETATATSEPTLPMEVQFFTATPGTNNSSGNYSVCDMASFVSDVSIPDGKEMAGREEFTKTWELRNDGTCTWTSGYKLAFYSGSKMGGPDNQQLTEEDVAPGDTLKVSVDLTAPASTGTYTGYWVLRNASGVNFGIGSGGSPFYVQIVVDSAAASTATITETVKSTRTPSSTLTATSEALPSDTPMPTETTTPSETVP